jgi:hypothetical protein
MTIMANEKYDPALIPTDFASVLSFSLGMLDAMRTLCAELIGLGVVPPDSFQADFARLADFWADKENAVRREPAAGQRSNGRGRMVVWLVSHRARGMGPFVHGPH